MNWLKGLIIKCLNGLNLNGALISASSGLKKNSVKIFNLNLKKIHLNYNF